MVARKPGVSPAVSGPPLCSCGSSWPAPCISHARSCSPKLSPSVAKETRVWVGSQEDSAGAEGSELEWKHAHDWRRSGERTSPEDLPRL